MNILDVILKIDQLENFINKFKLSDIKRFDDKEV